MTRLNPDCVWSRSGSDRGCEYVQWSSSKALGTHLKWDSWSLSASGRFMYSACMEPAESVGEAVASPRDEFQRMW
jgi:hypothetical protein